MSNLSPAQLKRDLITEAHILLTCSGTQAVKNVDLDALAEAVKGLYAAFPGFVEPGHFAPNPRETWPL